MEQKVVIEVRAPIIGPQIKRPLFDSPLTRLEPHIADSLKESVQKIVEKVATIESG